MKVTIYTIPDCPYSKEEKDYLTGKGVQYDEKDVSNNKDNLSEMLDLSNKFAGVPFSVVVKDSGEKVMLKGFTKADFDLVLDGGSEAQGQAEMPAGSATDMPSAGTVPGVIDTASMPATPPAMPTNPAMPAVEPTIPGMPAMPSIPDMSMPSAPSMTPDPVVPAMPSMPSAPSPEPVMPAVTPEPVMPAMPSAPSMTPDPVVPAMSSMPSAPSTEPADPQDELSGLLKDLEAKVSTPSVAPAGAPTAPADASAPVTPQQS